MISRGKPGAPHEFRRSRGRRERQELGDFSTWTWAYDVIEAGYFDGHEIGQAAGRPCRLARQD